jgi:cyclophilin family peptidyl-prolyl cis-trans isomerase
VHRQWSPLAADRFYQLVKHHYFNNTPLYRVVPDFVVQFGHLDSVTTNTWDKHCIKDEPVTQGNIRGTVAFATGGKDNRSSQLFINLKDNLFLDTNKGPGVTGFPVFGRVTKGMEIVGGFYSYGDQPNIMSDSTKDVPAYFKGHYPKMDHITKAYFIK